MASGVRPTMAALALLFVTSLLLLLLHPATGENPSYTECRPHIDATIRNLAAKAIVAGETPSEDLHPQDYDVSDEGTPEEPQPQIPKEPPATAEPESPVEPQAPTEPEVPEELPALVEPEVSEEPPAPIEPEVVPEPVPVVVPDDKEEEDEEDDDDDEGHEEKDLRDDEDNEEDEDDETGELDDEGDDDEDDEQEKDSKTEVEKDTRKTNRKILKHGDEGEEEEDKEDEGEEEDEEDEDEGEEDEDEGDEDEKDVAEDDEDEDEGEEAEEAILEDEEEDDEDDEDGIVGDEEEDEDEEDEDEDVIAYEDEEDEEEDEEDEEYEDEEDEEYEDEEDEEYEDEEDEEYEDEEDEEYEDEDEEYEDEEEDEYEDEEDEEYEDEEDIADKDEDESEEDDEEDEDEEDILADEEEDEEEDDDDEVGGGKEDDDEDEEDIVADEDEDEEDDDEKIEAGKEDNVDDDEDEEDEAEKDIVADDDEDEDEDNEDQKVKATIKDDDEEDELKEDEEDENKNKDTEEEEEEEEEGEEKDEEDEGDEEDEEDVVADVEKSKKEDKKAKEAVEKEAVDDKKDGEENEEEEGEDQEDDDTVDGEVSAEGDDEHERDDTDTKDDDEEDADDDEDEEDKEDKEDEGDEEDGDEDEGDEGEGDEDEDEAVEKATPVVEEPAPAPAPVPAFKPVHEEPEPVAPAKPKQPESQPKKVEEPRGIIDKLVSIIFGMSTAGPRDPKWLQPWQTHPEFKKVKKEEVKEVIKKVDTTPGIIHKFVSIIFGEPTTKQDPKWAQPWQTHPEFKKEKKAEVKEVIKKVDTSPGIIHKFVSLIFADPSEGERDAKWAQPWQSHKEHKKAPKVVEKVAEEKKVIHGASGGPLHMLVKLVFPVVEEDTKRDPKWSQPWQTHPEFARKAATKEEAAKEKKKEVHVAKGGLIDMFVKLVFTDIVPEGTKKDPKWAQPWQTHPEFAKKAASKEEAVKEKKKEVHGASGGLLDKFVKLVFTDIVPEGTKKDPKWAQPWQTHPEHVGKGSKTEKPKEETKKVVVGASGGLLDKLAKLVFDVPKEIGPRDPKWSEPWQTHKEHKKDAKKVPVQPQSKPEPVAPPPPKQPEPEIPPPPKQPEPQIPPPPKQPEPQIPPPPKQPEPQISPPPKQPEPVIPPPSKKPEPAPAPKAEPAPVQKPTLAPTPAPEPQPAAKPEAFHGTSGTPAAAPAGAAPVVDAPPPPRQPVLEQEAKKAPPPPPPSPREEEEEEEEIVVIPSGLRSRDRLEVILGLDQTSQSVAARTQPIAQASLTSLKSLYENTIRPLEALYKYQDISNRQMSDAELFGTPLVLLVGPYSTGKSSFINYILGIEYTKRALKTGTPPSHGVFRVIQYGESDSELDGTALSAQRNFASLQKFGQNFIDQLHGKALNNQLLKKVTLVEAPGILEMRRPGERLYPYNDVAQWFIDRADLILVMFDYTKLDAGYEMEAILDQLKGREAQTRILLNKADQVAAEELIKVQGSLFWNLSPLLGVSTPPTVYAGSFASRPYRSGSAAKLFQAQEEALLNDVARAINARVDNRIAIARRHAVRVRNHAQMVDTYLTTFYRNKGFLTSKHKLAEDIIENPHTYNIYEGISLLTNISRYDLPDPEVYRDFFRVHNLYDFQTLRATCSYFRGCPLTKIDAAISTELPDLLERYHRLVEAAIAAPGPSQRSAAPVPAPPARGSVPAAATATTS